MIIVEPGHTYGLHNIGPGLYKDIGHIVQFKRTRDERGRLLDPAEQREGPLAQELLRVLIDRTLYLNAEDPCNEDVAIVGHLRDALRLYEARAARRTIEKMPMPERESLCGVCGHLLCEHREAGRVEMGGSG